MEDKATEVKDYLQSKGNDVSGSTKKPIPTGAQQTAWFCLPPAPKDNYNEVYPRIILGNYYVAQKIDELKRLGVTAIVNCAQGTKFNQINTDENFFSDSGIQFHGIKALDILSFKLKPYFVPAADFIEDALCREGNVYVHCQSGMSRSGSVVLAYLMLKQRMRLMEAVKVVREKREIFPNDGFLKQLCELDSEIAENI